MTRFFTVGFFLFFIAITLNAQEVRTVPGNVIVQLYPNESIEDFISDHLVHEDKKADISLLQTLSPQLNIHLFQFNHNEVNSRAFLQAVRMNPKVFLAQFNHIGEFRGVIPNDTLFDQQWQYVNTGQGGGVVGADIDADLAWEITTGGYTHFGDTIVVCVVDNGTRLDHPDFLDNFWFNNREIPNNGIDDDGNGYIDDVRGWNVLNNSDSFTETFDAHGTSVAGIIGADGNNTTGITGVNWNVKVMNIRQGSTEEASVIAGYNYPYVMRKLYNETNGEKGAFVVAVNSSWGVDFGQPEDAPIWCNFYNVMGEEGILNTGATINGNVNVDIQGDLPTACQSDYLITVTNLNRNDVKVAAAGFGANTINLGAYGQGTYTLRRINGQPGYGAFGGTSAATPHVAGVIALMYATDCPSLSYLAKANPAAAALQIKNALLESVVPNASLAGITTTGGRLNAHTALLEILDQCEELPACLPPFVGQKIQSIDDLNLSYTVRWFNLNENPGSTTLRYRFNENDPWEIVTLDADAEEYTIENSQFCAQLEVQLQCECLPEEENELTTISEFSASFTRLTDGCCLIVEESTTSNISESGAEITWDTFFAAESFTIRYRTAETDDAAAGDWTIIENISSTSAQLTNLLACTVYEYELFSNCVEQSNETEGWSTTKSFRTLGCGACQDLAFCDSRGLNTNFEWINSVAFGEFFNPSGNNGGYADFTFDLESIDVERGQQIIFTLTPAFTGVQYAQRWMIAIDLNQDGVFASNEILFSTTSSSTQAVTDSLIIPSTAELGLTRMRIIMRDQAIPGPCAVFTFGEVEDYCLTINESTVGIVNNSMESIGFNLFPNPTNSNVTITTNEPFSGTVNIFNATGQLVDIISISGRDAITFNASNLASGVYMVQLIDRKGNTNTQRLVVN
ncbi:MAG: S8 family serine peptidase [Luteibaculaceae bacterium]